MLKPLIINEKEDTPRVLLDQQNELFEISGCSFPEDGTRFYSDVINWITDYIKEPCEETKFFFNLDYFNSTSVKQLLEILLKLEEITVSGKKIQVIWSYKKEDEMMAAKGEEIRNMVNLPFELMPV